MKTDTDVVLELAAEDDYALWEVAAAVSTLSDEVTDAPSVARARGAVMTLLAEGLIELVIPGVTAEEQTGAARELLEDPAQWQVPAHGAATLVVRVTQAGSSAYYRRGQSS